MNIMMLGDSGVGKTSFMVSAYALMSQGIFDFHIESTSDKQKVKFERLVKNLLGNGIYPAATDKQTKYMFNLLNENERIMTFTWTDYKGGSINYDDEDEEVKELKKSVKEADAVLMFVEADKLLNDPTVMSEVLTLHYYIQEYACANNKKLTLMPLFTKIDQVITKCDNLDTLWENLNAPFAELAKAAELNENIEFFPMAIACTMQCTLHLDWVMLFLMAQGIHLHYGMDSANAQKKLDLAKKEWEEGSALADLFGLSAKRDTARKIYEEYNNKVELLVKMAEAYDKIYKVLKNYEMWSPVF